IANHTTTFISIYPIIRLIAFHTVISSFLCLILKDGGVIAGFTLKQALWQHSRMRNCIFYNNFIQQWTKKAAVGSRYVRVGRLHYNCCYDS
ncbi:hypothetical protein P9747_02115, partial [Paenibacillus macerans]|uniref:hypothetical protein n=1 Tax=Paenibacillus macerans TaxID=44252 RepID=UPI002E21961C|nr:hypothetical protein [Paenibacillus macerans]